MTKKNTYHIFNIAGENVNALNNSSLLKNVDGER